MSNSLSSSRKLLRVDRAMDADSSDPDMTKNEVLLHLLITWSKWSNRVVTVTGKATRYRKSNTLPKMSMDSWTDTLPNLLNRHPNHFVMPFLSVSNEMWTLDVFITNMKSYDKTGSKNAINWAVNWKILDLERKKCLQVLGWNMICMWKISAQFCSCKYKKYLWEIFFKAYYRRCE